MIDQLRALISRHCETLKGEVGIIELDIRAICSSAEPSSELVRSAIARAHKLKGGSGTIGFQDISETAAELERTLKMLQQISGSVPEAVLAEIKRHFNGLAGLIRAVQPEQSRLFNVQLPAEITHGKIADEEETSQQQIRSAV